MRLVLRRISIAFVNAFWLFLIVKVMFLDTGPNDVAGYAVVAIFIFLVLNVLYFVGLTSFYSKHSAGKVLVEVVFYVLMILPSACIFFLTR